VKTNSIITASFSKEGFFFSPFTVINTHKIYRPVRKIRKSFISRSFHKIIFGMNNLLHSSLSTTSSSPFDSSNQNESSSTTIITTNSSSSSTMMSDIEEETTTVTTTDSNKRQKVRGSSPVGSMARTKTSSPRSFVISTANNHGATITTISDDDRSGRTSPTTSPTSSLLQLPTFEELSKVLCAIVDTDHYSRNDAIHALKNLARWGYSDNLTFLSNFSELGGIQRVLLYLKNNKMDPQCVMISAKVIMSCTHRNPHNNNNNQQHDNGVYNIANEITRYFTMRDGIRILLDAGKQYNNGGSVGEHSNNNGNDDNDGNNVVNLQLQALRWIWMVLMNVTEKSSTFDIVHKDQLLAIFDSGLETMTKLGKNLIPTNTTTAIVGVDNNNNNKDVVRSPVVVRNSNNNASSSAVLPYACGSADFQLGVVQRAFSSFCSPGRSRKRAAVDSIVREQHPRQPQGRNGSQERGGAVATATATTTTTVGTINNTKKPEGNVNTRLTSLILEDMFITLLNVAHNASMTRDDFQGMDLLQKCIGGMKKPNGEWIDDKELLVQASCFFVQCSKKQILSTNDDYEVAFPLIVECISKYPEESFRGGLFDLVRNAYSVVDKAFIRGSGIFGAVAAAWESTHVNEATKDASHQLLKELL
jgi:hypothetical protein